MAFFSALARLALAFLVFAFLSLALALFTPAVALPRASTPSSHFSWAARQAGVTPRGGVTALLEPLPHLVALVLEPFGVAGSCGEPAGLQALWAEALAGTRIAAMSAALSAAMVRCRMAFKKMPPCSHDRRPVVIVAKVGEVPVPRH